MLKIGRAISPRCNATGFHQPAACVFRPATRSRNGVNNETAVVCSMNVDERLGALVFGCLWRTSYRPVPGASPIRKEQFLLRLAHEELSRIQVAGGPVQYRSLQ